MVINNFRVNCFPKIYIKRRIIKINSFKLLKIIIN